jgi:tetratricopeptide (TPR) repeat protein
MRSKVFQKMSLVVVAIAALLTVGCASVPSEQRIDNIPMYGQPELPRPEILRTADDAFISITSAAFGGNREAASEAWWKQAEEYMANRNLDFAMRRYNQAWLLNPSSYKPYWGFARVMLERDKVDEAIKYLEKSKQLCNDSYQRVALLADTGTAYAYKAESVALSQSQERERYFDRSNENFRESTSLDPDYSNAWRRWAFALHKEGKFAEAWEKIKKARSLNAAAFPPAFLKALEHKMPEPK